MKMYDKDKKRLVYIREKATPDFWDNRWDVTDFKQTVQKHKNNRFCLSRLHKYIPDKKARILEGGCGSGLLVYCMHTHGYECIGIDFAERTVRRTKEAFPELDIRVGDVRNLPVPDNYFRGYWSLGIIEHSWGGYHDILSEMFRVLVKDGYVFLTFPYMSSLRKLKARLALYHRFNRELADTENFYQFALETQTVIKDFQEAGFKLITSRPQEGIAGFCDEVSLFRSLLRRCYKYSGSNLLVKCFRFLLNKILVTFAGHESICVFQKE